MEIEISKECIPIKEIGIDIEREIKSEIEIGIGIETETEIEKEIESVMIIIETKDHITIEIVTIVPMTILDIMAIERDGLITDNHFHTIFSICLRFSMTLDSNLANFFIQVLLLMFICNDFNSLIIQNYTMLKSSIFRKQ